MAAPTLQGIYRFPPTTACQTLSFYTFFTCPQDANWAGTKRASECTLILTEGDSAKALAVAGLAVVGRDAFGVFPLRGKLLNVRDVSVKAALESAEVAALVTILGLDFGRTYAGLAPEVRGLRYGRVMIMADQDVDGSHIKGLLINLFHTYWPALLQQGGGGGGADGGKAGADTALPITLVTAAAEQVGAAVPVPARRGGKAGAKVTASSDGAPLVVRASTFLEQFVTPVIKARRGATVREFFSVRDFDAWRREGREGGDSGAGSGGIVQPASGSALVVGAPHPLHPGRLYGEASTGRWAVKYYKGLGTSTSAEGRAYFSDLRRHRVPFRWGGPADGGAIQMAFAKDQVAARKAWLTAAPADGDGAGRAAAAPRVLESTSAPAGDNRYDDATAVLHPGMPALGLGLEAAAAGAAAQLATADTAGRPAAPVAPLGAPPRDLPGGASETAVTYGDFVHRELIEFSRADLVRSIPSVLDGLKPSQRKVLHACFRRAGSSGGGGGGGGAGRAVATEGEAGNDGEEASNGSGGDAAARPAPGRAAPAPSLGPEVKVAQLAGYVAEHTAYHHGEASLVATITGMAQDFVGANNVPLLAPLGQFGTRLAGGADAASARYIFTRLSPTARALFPQADDELLARRDDDGSPVEPVAYVPVAPLVLMNGAHGIGTGWSTSVPNYNPRGVVDAVEAALGQLGGAGSDFARFPAGGGGGGGEELRAAVAALPAVARLAPWWRGFKGEVQPAPGGDGYITVGLAAWERVRPGGETSAGTSASARRGSSAGGASRSASPRSSGGGGKAAPGGGEARHLSTAASRVLLAPKRRGAASGTAGSRRREDAVDDDSASDGADDAGSAAGPGGATHVRVTELPVGRWTEDYKAFLQGLVARGLVAEVREYHSEAAAEFLLALTRAGVEAALDARGGLAGFLRLATPVSTRNMHLFCPRGAIKRYAAPCDIIADFLPVRAGLYAARQLRASNLAADALARASARHRFLTEVTAGSLPLLEARRGSGGSGGGASSSKAGLAAELARRGYPFVLPASAAPTPVADSAAAAAADAAAADSAFGAAAHLVRPEVVHQRRVRAAPSGASPSLLAPPPGGYDYLLNLPVWQLTGAAVEAAAAEKAAASASAAVVAAAGPADAWRDDLHRLRAALAAAEAGSGAH
jgi:hypothetical protein